MRVSGATTRSDDHELVERLRRGDTAAFDRLYTTFHPRILAFLVRLSGRRDTAEDLAQETWLKLARAAPTLRDDTTLAALLFTIARNAFLSHRRWAMLDLSRLVMFGFETTNAGAPGSTPEMDHERSRSIALLEAALQQVPLASREILLLVGVEGMGQEEVALVLGVSYDALRQRLSRARAQLTEAMEKVAKRTAAERAAKPRGRKETA